MHLIFYILQINICAFGVPCSHTYSLKASFPWDECVSICLLVLFNSVFFDVSAFSLLKTGAETHVYIC